MIHVSLDSQDEVVKRFVLGLPIDPAGSVLELNGHPVACVVPVPNKPKGEWDEAKNNRRCDLIDRELDGPPLTPAEIVELAGLQDEMLRYRQRVAPLPINEVRQLHQRLLSKAAAQKPV